MRHFTLNLESDPSGTSVKLHFKTSYCFLKELFGDPKKEEGKVSHFWVFENGKGQVVTIYNWCIVRNKHDECGTMSERAFEQLPDYNWSIGAKNYSEAHEFVWWLNSRIENFKMNRIFKMRVAL
jgi:hypothetical protein